MSTSIPVAQRLAQAQLDAYNARNIDEFVGCYAESIELIDLVSGEVFCKGREELRVRYAPFFEKHPELYCKLVARIVCGEVAYDEELVYGIKQGEALHAVATYLVQDNLIVKAWFVKEK